MAINAEARAFDRIQSAKIKCSHLATFKVLSDWLAIQYGHGLDPVGCVGDDARIWRQQAFMYSYASCQRPVVGALGIVGTEYAEGGNNAVHVDGGSFGYARQSFALLSIIMKARMALAIRTFIIQLYKV